MQGLTGHSISENMGMKCRFFYTAALFAKNGEYLGLFHLCSFPLVVFPRRPKPVQISSISTDSSLVYTEIHPGYFSSSPTQSSDHHLLGELCCLKSCVSPHSSRAKDTPEAPCPQRFTQEKNNVSHFLNSEQRRDNSN